MLILLLVHQTLLLLMFIHGVEVDASFVGVALFNEISSDQTVQSCFTHKYFFHLTFSFIQVSSESLLCL